MYKKSSLLNFLAAHVLYIYFIHPHSLSRSGDFLIRKALVGIIFHREAFDQNQRLSAVFNDADLPNTTALRMNGAHTSSRIISSP